MNSVEGIAARIHARDCMSRLDAILDRAGDAIRYANHDISVPQEVISSLKEIAVSAATLSGTLAAARNDLDQNGDPAIINEIISQTELFCMVAEEVFMQN